MYLMMASVQTNGPRCLGSRRRKAAEGLLNTGLCENLHFTPKMLHFTKKRVLCTILVYNYGVGVNELH